MQEILYSFVKVQKGVNSRWRVAYHGSSPLAECHLSQWAGEGWEVWQRSFSNRINMKWLHPQGVIDGLITAGMRCQAARRDVWQTCLEWRKAWATMSWRKMAAIAFEVVISVTCAVFYDVPGYLADDFSLAGHGRPGSRSAASMMLDIPRTMTSLGDRAFALPDRVSGTAFLLPSVIRHCRCQSSESCWKPICLFKGHGAGDLWTLKMYWLTN